VVDVGQSHPVTIPAVQMKWFGGQSGNGQAGWVRLEIQDGQPI